MFGMVRLSLVLSCTMIGCSCRVPIFVCGLVFFQVKDLNYFITMLFQFHLISLFDFSVYSNVIISELFPNKYFDEFYSILCSEVKDFLDFQLLKMVENV